MVQLGGWRLGSVVMMIGVAACSKPPPQPPAGMGLEASPPFLANLEPMIVDWQPEQRGDLEIAMREGVVVVGFDTDGFRLLKDCSVKQIGGAHATYQFMGTTRRERVIRLETAEEVRANLPLGGLGLLAQLGGELSQGATLDVAMVMVGKLRTSYRSVRKQDLDGQCERASHFVRGATVGAFAMDKGHRSQARAALEIFGVGAGGGAAQTSAVRVIDGQLQDCGQATPDSSRPPSQCGAMIRVELLPLAGSEEEASKLAGQELALLDTCQPPMVSAEGKCVQPESIPASARECRYGDAQDCASACKASNTRSCVLLSFMMLNGEGGAQASPSDAATLAARSCQAGDSLGCLLYGGLLHNGLGIGRNLEQALRVYLKACQDGEAGACASAGTMLLVGQGEVKRDPLLAAKVLGRGCSGGDHGACSDLGLLALGGQGFDKDLPFAAKQFKRSCEGGNAVGCSNYGYMLEFGEGIARDDRAAALTYAKACQADDSQCMWLGAMVQLGKGGLARDEAKAMMLYRAACQANYAPGCALLRAYVDPTQSYDQEQFDQYVALWRSTCQASGPRDCSGLGVLMMAQGRREDAKAYLQRGCELGDDWGCLMARANPR